uniref:Uncharacterized protein n=1 Tax=Knipowitschia caucasica TaxID=637954 RepID=A0AAV2LFR7_KNICA
MPSPCGPSFYSYGHRLTLVPDNGGALPLAPAKARSSIHPIRAGAAELGFAEGGCWCRWIRQTGGSGSRRTTELHFKQQGCNLLAPRAAAQDPHICFELLLQK